ncbi:MAG: 4-hydroxythreonine-4-phosphate dehydrogenase PdxA [Terrimicrobiaceae bacterium]
MALKAASDPDVLAVCEPVFVGDPAVWQAASREFGIPLPGRVHESGNMTDGFARGRVDAACGRAAYAALIEAIRLVEGGEAGGIVTAPLNKAAMNAGGIHEVGHTEILAKETKSQIHALMLYSPRIACAFVTCHQSYASVPGSLRVDRVLEVAGLMQEALLRIRGTEPCLALLGLNPHAGEDGLFGDEEIRILQPAAAEARRRGILLSDPLPADTAFTPAALSRYDGHVCLYHDQGGIPFKMLSFEDGVNITLGLPWVRTSVDHGTAFDIAWSGSADPGSMKAAILLAARLAVPLR